MTDLEQLQRIFYIRLGYTPTDVQERIIANLPNIHAPRRAGTTYGLILRTLAEAKLGNKVKLTCATQVTELYIRRTITELLNKFNIPTSILDNVTLVTDRTQRVLTSTTTVEAIEQSDYYYKKGRYKHINTIR